MVPRAVAAVCVFAAVWGSPAKLSGCGDKFLVLGRDIGYGQLLKASHPGRLVLYTSPQLPAAFTDGRVAQVLRSAGHRVTTVSSTAELSRALADGSIDLIIADVPTTRQVSTSTQTPSAAQLVPIVLEADARERAGLEKQFGFVLRVPSDARHFLDTLDKAMKLRAKRRSGAA